MEIVVRNTFLAVTPQQSEQGGAVIRSHSTPPDWRPASVGELRIQNLEKTTWDADGSISPRSDASFYTAPELNYEFSELTTTIASADERSCSWPVNEADLAAGPSLQCGCMTPTSVSSSPRQRVASPFVEDTCVFNVFSDQAKCVDCADVAQLPCSFTNVIRCATPEDVDAFVGQCAPIDCQWPCFPPSDMCYDTVPEPEDEPGTIVDVCAVDSSLGARTVLKSSAAAFQPKLDAPVPQAPACDARVEAVVSCIHLALASCGQIRNINIEKGLACNSSTLILAELHGGPKASSRAYDVMHLAKQSLEAIKARLPTMALLNSRVQKEDCGYSLRSSIACLPDHAKDYACWDMFNKNYCPRRGVCRWYHPSDSDITRIKVTVRYGDDAQDVILDGSEEQFVDDLAAERHNLSLVQSYQ